MRRWWCLIFLCLVVGCEAPRHVRDARRGVDAYRSGDYAQAVQTLQPLADRKDEHYVLNNLRLASAAQLSGDGPTQERALLRAYDLMNASAVNDAGRRFAAVAFDEKLRVWRGEPFERAVANLQLAMIYYGRGDYDNARGGFENALFKLDAYDESNDRRSANEFESDFAAALLMLGRTWRHLGRDDEAERYLQRLRQSRPELGELAGQMADLNRNVLVYVETGFAPRKVADGMDGATLSFYPRPGQTGAPPVVRVSANGRAISDAMTATFDTVWMAQQRRWQDIDTVRATKSVIGTGLIVAGAGTTLYGADRRDQGAAIAGIGMILAGALLKASSEADTRVWEMCPRAGFLVPIYVPPGTHEFTIESAGLIEQVGPVVIPPDGETLIQVRLKRNAGRLSVVSRQSSAVSSQ
jgi:tetratricopeptide (TPR) repeat protein